MTMTIIPFPINKRNKQSRDDWVREAEQRDALLPQIIAELGEEPPCDDDDGTDPEANTKWAVWVTKMALIRFRYQEDSIELLTHTNYVYALRTYIGNKAAGAFLAKVLTASEYQTEIAGWPREREAIEMMPEDKRSVELDRMGFGTPILA
jgi:hypothetical protein